MCCHLLIYSLTLDIVQDVSDRDRDKAGEGGGGVSTDGCGEEGVSKHMAEEILETRVTCRRPVEITRDCHLTVGLSRAF